MSTWNALLPVITLLIGSTLTYYAQRSLDTRQRQAAIDAAEATAARDRQRELETRRETFELTHLMDVHRALIHSSEVASRLFEEAMQEAGTTGKFRERFTDPEYERACDILINASGFVLDDEIRATIGRTIEAEMLFLLNKTDVGRHQPPALRRRYVDAHVEARQAIARRVREIYRSM